MSFTSKITLGTTPKINITDTSTYGDPSIVKGIVNIEGPNGWSRSGTNADIADYTTSTTSIDIILPVDSDGNPINGDYKVTLVTEGSVTTNTVTYKYTHLKVVPTISFDVQVPAAYVKVKETTGYGSGFQSTVRELRIEYPQGIDPEVADLVTTASEKVISPLYSGTYTVTLTNTYQLLVDGLNIEGSFVQPFEREVDNDARLCSAQSCIKNVQLKYEAALKNNPGEAKDLADRIMSMLMGYMNYTISVNCGKPDQSFVNGIIAEAELCGCSCNDCGTVEGPQLISPLIPGLSESNDIWFGSGVPANGLGKNGDVYIDTANGDVYKKENEVYGASKMNIKGPKGDKGDPGDDGNFTYTGYCTGFDSGGIAQNFATTPTSASNFSAVKVSATVIATINEATFAGRWTHYKQEPKNVSPIVAISAISNDVSRYYNHGIMDYHDLDFRFTPGSDLVVIAFDLKVEANFKGALIYCTNLDKSIIVTPEGGSAEEIGLRIVGGGTFVSGTEYRFKGQMITF